MRKKSNYLKYKEAALFLMLWGVISAAFADEILTADGKRYEGVIVNQSPSEVTIRLKDRIIKLNRSDLKYIKRWTKQENEALTEKWTDSQSQDTGLRAKEEEFKYADSVKFSTQPWEIYEEDAFIAFHRQEGIVRGRLAGKVGDYCKKVAQKLGYREFKIYDGKTATDWNLKFKFYSYRDFNSWRQALAAKGMSASTVAAFAAGHRRVFFYELYMKEDVIYHEISHEIYKEFIKNANVPTWWHEGIAQYTLLTTQEAREDISKSRFRALNNKHISLSVDTYADLEHTYQDGLSLVYFLVRDKGQEKFREFNYKLRKGTKFEKALFEVYDFKNIDALEKAWVEYLKSIDVKDMVGN